MYIHRSYEVTGLHKRKQIAYFGKYIESKVLSQMIEICNENLLAETRVNNEHVLLSFSIHL